MGVAPGDGVVVPQLTFYASAETIPPTGARPVLCGIDLETFCTTAETAKASLTPRTEAAIAVRAFWNLAPVAEIEALGVPVLEDAAQVAGTTTSPRTGAGDLEPQLQYRLLEAESVLRFAVLRAAAMQPITHTIVLRPLRGCHQVESDVSFRDALGEASAAADSRRDRWRRCPYGGQRVPNGRALLVFVRFTHLAKRTLGRRSRRHSGLSQGVSHHASRKPLYLTDPP